jgi:glycosyltransferase involved in cell wall biosynthesis
MKILWLSHFVPFPPRGGHLQRSFHLIRQASTFAEVSLVAFNQLNEPLPLIREHVNELRRFCNSVTIWDPPLPWKGARWWVQLLSNPRPEIPMAARSLWSVGLAKQLRSLADREEFDIVHFDSLELAPYRRGLQSKLVLNLHNGESAMMLRRAKQETSRIRRSFIRGEGEALRSLEREAYPEFDIVLAVSTEDAKEVCRTEPRAHTHVVENGTDCSYFSPLGEGSPGEVVFAGAYNWYPNANAASYLVSEVWPLVQEQCPQAHLTIAGKQPPAALRGLIANATQVSLVADPEDIRPALGNASIVVCPIQEGGGTRLKILDAMSMAKPVVSTSTACAGLRVSPRENILIADGAREIAHSIQLLLNDSALRARIGSAGRRMVQEQYDWHVIGQQLLQAYRCKGECTANHAAVSQHAMRGGS